MDGVPVAVDGSGVVVHVRAGESLFHAARRQGLEWPTACHGNARCTLCAVRVDAADAGAFSPPSAEELAALGRLRPAGLATGPAERLACRLRVEAPGRVTKRGVRSAGTPWKEIID